MKKIKLYQDPELDEERRQITKQLTPEEEKLKFKRRSIKNKLHFFFVFVINKPA